MNDFLHFSYNTLNLLDHKIHDTIKGSFVDDFIHELQDHLKLQLSNSILENLPPHTNLHFAKFEGDFAVCFDYSTKTLYDIPKSYFKGILPEIGDAINMISPKEFRIDSTGIPANPNYIDILLKECSYSHLSSKRLPEYYSISSIGMDYAICKNINTNKTENIPIDDIPKNAKNGDTLLYTNGNFILI